MREEEANGLAVVGTTTSLGKSGTDIDRLDAIALLLLLGVGHCVGDNNTAQAAAVDVLDSLAGENAVDNDGVDFLGTVLHDGVGGLDEGTTGISHVVDDDGDLVLDVSDQNHAGDFIGSGTFLVNEGELQIETISDGGGTGKQA